MTRLRGRPRGRAVALALPFEARRVERIAGSAVGASGAARQER